MRAKVHSRYISQGDGIRALGEMPCMSRHDALQLASPTAHVVECRPTVGCPLSMQPAGLSVPSPQGHAAVEECP